MYYPNAKACYDTTVKEGHLAEMNEVFKEICDACYKGIFRIRRSNISKKVKDFLLENGFQIIHTSPAQDECTGFVTFSMLQNLCYVTISWENAKE